MCTAIQNIGLVIAPTVVGYIQEKTADNMFGYYWVNFFFVCVNIAGLIMNLTLYYLDIKYYDGVLDKVDKATRVTELMTSPDANKSRKDILRESLQGGTRQSQALIDYKLDDNARASLRRSLATKRPYQ